MILLCFIDNQESVRKALERIGHAFMLAWAIFSGGVFFGGFMFANEHNLLYEYIIAWVTASIGSWVAPTFVFALIFHCLYKRQSKFEINDSPYFVSHIDYLDFIEHKEELQRKIYPILVYDEESIDNNDNSKKIEFHSDVSQEPLSPRSKSKSKPFKKSVAVKRFSAIENKIIEDV